jgi:HAMP domain-containing protein
MTSNATLRVGRRELVAMVIGVLLYGGIAWLTKFSDIAGTVGADIRPAVAIPIFFGFVYGPIVGFVTGMFGNFLGDALLGYLAGYPLPPDFATGDVVRDVFIAYYLNWQIGNGLSGMIPGIMALYHKRYYSLKDQLHAFVYMTAGVVVGMGFAGITDMWIYNVDFQTSYEVFSTVIQHNFFVSAFLVPLLLFNYARLDMLDFRGTKFLQSGLLRRLATTIVISAAVPTVLLGLFLALVSERDETLLIKLLAAGLITLAFTAVNSTLAAQSISRPLLRLTDAASDMQMGQLDQARAKELQNTEADDEIGQLSRMFGKMAVEVLQREENLKRQVEALKIEIDQAKQSKQVAEITDNEFFRELQSKAKYLRSRDKSASDQPTVFETKSAVSHESGAAEETQPPQAIDGLLSSDEPESPAGAGD